MRDTLQTHNRRNCLRKDRDHPIGHSLFMGVPDEAGFNRLFDKHVIPLLQEYISSDWEGLRFVVGEKNMGANSPGRDPSPARFASARVGWRRINGRVPCQSPGADDWPIHP